LGDPDVDGKLILTMYLKFIGYREDSAGSG